MAFSTKIELPGTLLSNCGGLRRPWAQGTGVINGITKVDNLAASCRVFLYTGDGTLRGYRRTKADGLYTFLGLHPGDYRLVVEDDQQGTRRSKVEHVRL